MAEPLVGSFPDSIKLMELQVWGERQIEGFLECCDTHKAPPSRLCLWRYFVSLGITSFCRLGFALLILLGEFSFCCDSRCGHFPACGSPGTMLASLMTALFFVVRVFGKLGSSLLFREEQTPYLTYQPLPWHVQYVTQNRRASKDQERRGSCQHTCTTYPARDKYGQRRASPRKDLSLQDPSERAALTIQSHYRKYQQHKHQPS